MLSNPKYAIALALLLIVAVAALVLTSGSDAPDEQATASPTQAAVSPSPPTATPAAQATPHPSPAPDGNPFTDFRLEPETGNFEFGSVDISQLPEEAGGIWFMDVETGEVSGWTSQVGAEPYGFAGDNRLMAFRRRTQVFREGVVYHAGFLLADRVSGTAYRWEGDAEPVFAHRSSQGVYDFRLAAGGGRALLRIGNRAGEDWFAVFDFDAREIASTFRASGTAGLLAPDGMRAVVLGDRLTIVELSTGNTIDVDVAVSGTAFSLQNSMQGAGILVSSAAGWAHFTWDGELLAEGAGAAETYPAPSGDVLAMVEPLVGAAPDQSWPQLYMFSAVDTATGEAFFRVIGVIPSFGYTTGNPWLADGSGIVVSDPAFQLSVAMRDGSFRPYVGMPSPESASLFAVGSPVDGGPAVVDIEGNVIVSAMPPGRAVSFVPPWGLTGAEIRFITPHGGHGGIGYALSLVQPVVEQPPYNEPAALQVRQEAAGAELLDEPGGGNVVGTLTGLRVVVQEVAAVRMEPSHEAYSRHCDLWNLLSAQPAGTECRGVIWGGWARVVTETGDDAWLLLQVSPEGA